MGKLSIGSIGFWLMIILLVVACAPTPAPGSTPTPVTVAPTPAASVPKAPAKEVWEEQWERLVSAARREGKLIMYGSQGGVTRQAITSGLRMRYGIELESVAGRGAEMSAKLFAERRAGLYLVDVYQGGATTLVDSFRPAGILDPLDSVLVLPEVTNPKVWWQGRLPFVDPEHTIFGFGAYVSVPLAINTDLVKPGDIKSYRDLLNPKWKGKILMNDPTVSGTGATTFACLVHAIMREDFMRELAKQAPMITRDQRQQVEWLARGKYAILIAPKSEVQAEFGAAGAPIANHTPAEGSRVTAGDMNVTLINRAPHPNAAKVFINWLLSKEGVKLFTEAYGRQGARVDVPTDRIDPEAVRQPGVKYFDSDEIEFKSKVPEYMKLAEKIFGDLIPK